MFKNGQILSRFYGGRTVDEITPFMAAVAKNLDPFEEEKRLRPGLYLTTTTSLPDLSPETFNATVKRPAELDNNVVYVVKFYSDKCPHCKSMRATMQEAAELLIRDDPRVRILAVNGRIYSDLDSQNAITGYPRLCSYYNGVKVHETNAAGSPQDIVGYAVSVADALYNASLGKAPELIPAQYDEQKLFKIPDIAHEFLLKDSVKWATIEAEKREGELRAQGASDAEIASAKAEIFGSFEALANTQRKGLPPPVPLEKSGMFAESIKSMGARHLYGDSRVFKDTHWGQTGHHEL